MHHVLVTMLFEYNHHSCTVSECGNGGRLRVTVRSRDAWLDFVSPIWVRVWLTKTVSVDTLDSYLFLLFCLLFFCIILGIFSQRPCFSAAASREGLRDETPPINHHAVAAQLLLSSRLCDPCFPCSPVSLLPWQSPDSALPLSPLPPLPPPPHPSHLRISPEASNVDTPLPIQRR